MRRHGVLQMHHLIRRAMAVRGGLCARGGQGVNGGLWWTNGVLGGGGCLALLRSVCAVRGLSTGSKASEEKEAPSQSGASANAETEQKVNGATEEEEAKRKAEEHQQRLFDQATNRSTRKKGGWNVSFEWSEVGLAVVTLLGMVYLWFAVLPDWFGWATASLASDLAKEESTVANIMKKLYLDPDNNGMRVVLAWCKSNERLLTVFLKEGLLEETLTRMKDEADIRTSAMQVLQKALDEDATRKFVMSSRNTMEWIFNNFVYGTPADATLCARLLVKVAQDPDGLKFLVEKRALECALQLFKVDEGEFGMEIQTLLPELVARWPDLKTFVKTRNLPWMVNSLGPEGQNGLRVFLYSALLGRANVEHKNGDLDVALSMYRKCAEIMQAHEMITLSIASILKLQGKYTEAAEEYRKLLSMMNLDVPLEDLEGKGEGSKADRISRVIVGERDVIVGYAELVLDLPFRPGLGMKRPTSQEYTQAINYLKKLIRAGRIENVEGNLLAGAYKLLIQTYEREGQLPMAIDLAREFVSRSQKTSSPLLLLGRLLIKNNSPNDAIRVLETAAELAPTGADNFFALAKAYLLKKDTDKALEAIITCSDLCLKGVISLDSSMENLKKRIEYAAKELKENPPDSPEDDPARGQTEKQIPLPLVEQQKRHKELHEMKVERKRMILAASQSLYLEGQIRGLRGEWEGKAHALQSSIKLLTGADFVVSPDDDKAQALTSSPVVNSIRLSKLFYQIGICAEKQGKIDEAATAYGLVLQSWANHCSPNAPVRTTIQSLLANVAERKALAHMEAFGNTSVSSMPFLHSKYQAIMQMAAEEANRSAAAGSNSSAPLMSV